DRSGRLANRGGRLGGVQCRQRDERRQGKGCESARGDCVLRHRHGRTPHAPAVVSTVGALLRSSLAELSPKLSMSSRPIACSIVNIALAIGVPSAALTCRPPLIRPPAWPAMKSGARRWLWMFESASGEP